MSRIDRIDSASLRRRLQYALDRIDDAGLRGASLYCWALGACYLACSDPREEAALEALFYAQAASEPGIDGDETLSAIIMAGQARS